MERIERALLGDQLDPSAPQGLIQSVRELGVWCQAHEKEHQQRRSSWSSGVRGVLKWVGGIVAGVAAAALTAWLVARR